MMSSHSMFSLRSALQFVKSSDIPIEHKSLLIDVLSTVLRDHADPPADAPVVVAEAPWNEAERLMLQAHLAGKTATSWQHADELLMHLAHLLGREPHRVRSKAADLGYGASVDYRLARILVAERTAAEG